MKHIIVPIIPINIDDPAILRRLLMDYSICLSNIIGVMKTLVEQNKYDSGSALASYGAGANGFDTADHASELHAMVVKIRAALIENGIMV